VKEFGLTDKELDYLILHHFKYYKALMEGVVKAPQLTFPPHITTFEEKESKPEEVAASPDNMDTEALLVPTFMTVSQNIHLTTKGMVDQIFTDHRCVKCARYLCCAGTIFHDVNCWYFDFVYEISIKKLRDIQTYRMDVFMGVMKQWEEYAFEPFDQLKHIREKWGPHHFGFYVRCFTCKVCVIEDSLQCHAPYHHHV
jgi:hypothetical protein